MTTSFDHLKNNLSHLVTKKNQTLFFRQKIITFKGIKNRNQQKMIKSQ